MDGPDPSLSNAVPMDGTLHPGELDLTIPSDASTSSTDTLNNPLDHLATLPKQEPLNFDSLSYPLDPHAFSQQNTLDPISLTLASSGMSPPGHLPNFPPPPFALEDLGIYGLGMGSTSSAPSGSTAPGAGPGMGMGVAPPASSGQGHTQGVSPSASTPSSNHSLASSPGLVQVPHPVLPPTAFNGLQSSLRMNGLENGMSLSSAGSSAQPPEYKSSLSDSALSFPPSSAASTSTISPAMPGSAAADFSLGSGNTSSAELSKGQVPTLLAVDDMLQNIALTALSAREACATGRGEAAEARIDELKKTIEMVAELIANTSLSSSSNSPPASATAPIVNNKAISVGSSAPPHSEASPAGSLHLASSPAGSAGRASSSSLSPPHYPPPQQAPGSVSTTGALAVAAAATAFSASGASSSGLLEPEGSDSSRKRCASEIGGDRVLKAAKYDSPPHVSELDVSSVPAQGTSSNGVVGPETPTRTTSGSSPEALLQQQQAQAHAQTNAQAQAAVPLPVLPHMPPRAHSMPHPAYHSTMSPIPPLPLPGQIPAPLPLGNTAFPTVPPGGNVTINDLVAASRTLTSNISNASLSMPPPPVPLPPPAKPVMISTAIAGPSNELYPTAKTSRPMRPRPSRSSSVSTSAAPAVAPSQAYSYSTGLEFGGSALDTDYDEDPAAYLNIAAKRRASSSAVMAVRPSILTGLNPASRGRISMKGMGMVQSAPHSPTSSSGDSDHDSDRRRRSSSVQMRNDMGDGGFSTGGNDIPAEFRGEVDHAFFDYLNRICSNLESTDGKGEPIHQTLMAKKMQRLDESPDFRPFKFRIQAFTNGFLEELSSKGYPEEKIPMKKIRSYLWNNPYISRYNEEGRKAKSKGNHIWNIDAKKIHDGTWQFRAFHRKLAGNPPSVAYVGLNWVWQPRIWDPQASKADIPVKYSSPSLPPWLSWKDDVLSGTPPPDAQSCDIIAEARFMQDDQEELLKQTVHISIAPISATDLSFPKSRRPSMTTLTNVSYMDDPRRTTSETAVPQAVAASYPRPSMLRTQTTAAPVQPVAARDEQVVQVLWNAASRVMAEAQQTQDILAHTNIIAPHAAVTAEPALVNLTRQHNILTLTATAVEQEVTGMQTDEYSSRNVLADASRSLVLNAAQNIMNTKQAEFSAYGYHLTASEVAPQVTVNDVTLATQTAIAQAVSISGPTSSEVDVMMTASSLLRGDGGQPAGVHLAPHPPAARDLPSMSLSSGSLPSNVYGVNPLGSSNLAFPSSHPHPDLDMPVHAPH